MQDVTTMDTKDIVAALEPYVSGDQSGTELLDELKFREVKENDLDDTTKHRGGIRPNHQPLV